MYLDLYHTIQHLYKKDAHPWATAEEVDAFVVELFQMAERFKGRFQNKKISAFFGWNADKQFPKASLCGALLKHLRGFVNTSIM